MQYLLALALSGSVSPAANVHDVLTSPYRHVRSTDARVTAALADGMRRSPTFAELIHTLNRSDVIVYVQSVDKLPATLLGRMMLLTKAQTRAWRYVRIQVLAQTPTDELVSIIGHELQHAVEIAENREVRDQAALTALYQRIGAGRSDTLGFDTEAAQVAGTQIKRELRGRA